jgi:hypothetical protein
LPSLARLGGFGFALGVGDQAGEDGITDAPLQATQRLFVGLAFF